MTWKKSIKNGARIAFGVTVASGVAAIGILLYDKSWREGILFASWTTGYEPTVRWDSDWDKRDPKSMIKEPQSDVEKNDYNNNIKKQTPTATRHLLLVRHGQYNLLGATDEQCKLTELGAIQVDLTGARLKELNFSYTKLISSTMTRAMETSSIIHKHLSHLPIEYTDIIREGAPIPPEPPSGAWKPEQKKFFSQGARIEAGFRKYFHRADPEQSSDSYEIFSCHANVIRYYVCRALQFPPEGWLRIALHHGSITWITIRPNGRVTLRTLGDSGHIPAHQLSVS